MNTYAAFRSLLFLATASFFFGGCERPDLSPVGLPKDFTSLGARVTDTVQLRAAVVREPALRTDNLVRHVFGFFKDPRMGTTLAQPVFQVWTAGKQLKFEDDAVLDSLVLTLRYAGFYGDSTANFTIRVRELDQSVADTNYQDAGYALKAGNWAEKTFVPNLKDSLTIQLIRKGKTDTLQKVPPQLRIRLDDALGKAFLTAHKGGHYETEESFLQYFKGLLLECDSDKTTLNGGLINFDLLSDQTALRLYYHTPSDTFRIDYPIDEKCKRANLYRQNHTGSEAEAHIKDSTLNTNRVFVQPLGGLSTRLSFPFLRNLIPADSAILVNKAELVFSVESGSDNVYGSPTRMILVTRDLEAGKEFSLPDQNFGSSYFGGSRSEQKEYKFNVALYLQKLLSGETDEPLYLVTAGKAISGERVVLNGTNSPTRMKLNLVYTIVKK